MYIIFLILIFNMYVLTYLTMQYLMIAIHHRMHARWMQGSLRCSRCYHFHPRSFFSIYYIIYLANNFSSSIANIFCNLSELSYVLIQTLYYCVKGYVRGYIQRYSKNVVITAKGSLYISESSRPNVRIDYLITVKL